MTEAAGLYIGLDLGTSALKGVALDASGKVVAKGWSAYPTSRLAAGAAEQLPEDWISAVEQVAAQLAVHAATDRWRAIGLSAMIPTLVTVGADGAPNGPAITWQDSRAEAQADELRERCGADDLYQITGQWVDGRYLLPMFLRLAETEPGRAASTTSLLGAKDYLFGVLTGEVATDPSTASGFGCYQLATGRWDGRILTAAADLARLGEVPRPCDRPGPGTQAGPGSLARPGNLARPGRLARAGNRAMEGSQAMRWLPALPPVLPSAATRPLRAETASRLGCGQIPVCLGAADSVLGVLGLGIGAPGQIGYVAGTSTVVLGVADRLLLDPLHRFLVVPLTEPGRWGLEMDLLATGSALCWLAELLDGGLDEAAVMALAAGTEPADAPVLLPYFSPGEQGALWDPTLHGTVAGLTFGHGRPHLARGLVNGILLESRRCLAVLDETGPFDAELYVAGGGAAEASFRADLADATGRRVVMPGGQDTDLSARGAALLAAQAVGQPVSGATAPACSAGPPAGPRQHGGTSDRNPGDAEAEARNARPAAQVSEPDVRRAPVWDELYANYERARRAITLHYHGDRLPVRPQ